MTHAVVSEWINKEGELLLERTSKLILEDAEPFTYSEYIPYDQVLETGGVNLGFKITISQMLDINSPLSRLQTHSLRHLEDSHSVPPKSYFMDCFEESVDYILLQHKTIFGHTFLGKYNIDFIKSDLITRFSEEMDNRMGSRWS